MLPKRRRISRHLFPNDPRTGAVFHAPHVSLRVTSRTLPVARTSVVVSKKSTAKATDRHLIKRRIYDAIARIEREAPLIPALYVFFVKKDTHTITYSQLRGEIATLLEQANDSIVKPSRLV